MTRCAFDLDDEFSPIWQHPHRRAESASEALSTQRPPGSAQVGASVGASGPHLTLREFREKSERQYIVDTLKGTGWNISRTAVLLGVERTNLHKKIRTYAIKRGEG